MSPTRLLITAALSAISLLASEADKPRAQAMVKEAVAFGKKEGKAALLKEVNFAQGRFHVKSGGELYIFVFDLKGQALAHGFQSNLVNVNRWDHKDADGRHFVQDFISIAKTKGSGWVDYRYTDPKTGKVEAKTSFIELVDDYLVGCGIYK